MSQDRILIWNSFPLKKREGGPSTYLYNLRESAKLNNIDNIDFVDDYKPTNKPYKKPDNKVKKFYKRRIKPYLSALSRRKKRTRRRLMQFLTQEKSNLPANLDLSNYNYIHFHITYDYFVNRNLLKDYKGKILLTSHCPKAMHKEVFEDWLHGIEFSDKEKEKIEAVDTFAFTNADYVIFPCEEAQEPYRNSWDKYQNINFKNKVLELRTCSFESEVKLSKNEVLKKYNIPDNSFIISYFGRHNGVKGYDILKEFGEKILKTHPDVYFLVAGKQEPFYGLENKRWIEVGWTQDPHSLVGASDLYILPNRETYFDLALLEVLSIGSLCLISYTGGNKFFKRLPKQHTQGILFFQPNDIDDLTEKFEYVYSNGNEIKNKNKALFEKYFDNKNFAPNYLSVIQKIGLNDS